MGVETHTAPLEISMEVFQKIRNQSTSSPSNTMLGDISKRCTLIPQGHLLNCIYSSIIHNSQNLKKKLDAPHLKNGERKCGTFTQWSTTQQ